jgi:hypothetical protein
MCFLLWGMTIRSKERGKSQNSQPCMGRRNRATNWLSN